MKDQTTRHDNGRGRDHHHHGSHHHHDGPRGTAADATFGAGTAGRAGTILAARVAGRVAGEARYILLDALRDGPKHGYEIIKALEEKSGGRYAPSPGTVYPTMQLLEDQGLVRADQEAERRVYALTEAGRADLESHAEEVTDFWARFAEPATPPASRPEVGFLRDDLDDLARTVWGGLRDALNWDDPETVRAVRQALARCREEVRAVIGRRASSEPRPDGPADLL